VSPHERAAAAYAAAELAEHPADKASLKGAARLWERIAGPGVEWSLEPLRRDLIALKRELALSTAPFQPPRPPKAAPVASPYAGRIHENALTPVEAIAF
jgi:hypothetical protein